MIAMFLLAAAVVYLQNNSIIFHELLHGQLNNEEYMVFLSFLLQCYVIFCEFDKCRLRRVSNM
jgi:hypothetical protein